jgi:uncharacterized surface protein with fasciclin (FAS1) repeats
MKGKFLFLGIILMCIVLSGFLFPGCVKSTVPPSNNTSYTITDLIQSASNLSVLDSALKKTHEDTLFKNYGEFTYFVATDGVYLAAGISDSTVGVLPDSILVKIVLYGAIPQAIPSSQLPAGPDAVVQTQGGDSIFVTNSSSGIFINGIPLAANDAVASNGIIDAVSYPLLPPTGNLLQVIQSDTSFSYFAAAVNRTALGTVNVANILAGPSIYTVFLPNNAAFSAAGYATINDINNANIDTLTRIIQYHIVPLRIFTSDFQYGSNQTTLLTGNSISLGTVGSSAYAVRGNKNVSVAVISNANIMAHNGVIHVINQVLMP